ncbi:putative lipoprotein YbjP precursor [Sodalis glossinidius str. 'morsitans']|uniref:Lipoprotein n=1 Tax=Sodalis glossinidius (strain morsitans) TaxID=343509 RepID=Q2NU03_SODGM|nr:putative lipoprotein [Sodalis glossinidius str. 'morsitans']CRL44991.1 putative lipoprotein YbjP precursor [Sodalis glossinidius str. 'morsitans']
MKKTSLVLLPLMLTLSACSAVKPAYDDVGSRSAPCVQGGPDSVAQQFFDLRLQPGNQGKPDTATLARYRPYFSTALYHSLAEDSRNAQKLARLPVMDIFSGDSIGPTTADVHSASRIPNTDAKNIPLRGYVATAKRRQSECRLEVEVLMIREGTCWVVDDVRYLGAAPPATAGTLRKRWRHADLTLCPDSKARGALTPFIFPSAIALMRPPEA